MQVGTGKSILNGIAIGKLKLYKKKNTTISAAEVADTAAEIERFEDARAKAIDQQTALYEKALAEAGPEAVDVPGNQFHGEALPFRYPTEYTLSGGKKQASPRQAGRLAVRGKDRRYRQAFRFSR